MRKISKINIYIIYNIDINSIYINCCFKFERLLLKMYVEYKTKQNKNVTN